MWAVRESSSSMVTPRFLAEDEGVTIADPRVIERSWEMDGLAGTSVHRQRIYSLSKEHYYYRNDLFSYSLLFKSRAVVWGPLV